jgi:catechol 2,3-dioxygenase-like lactoylglutathione lyase family enzyme
MLTAVRSVGVYAGDQERSKRFFTETLGFKLLQDTPMGDGPGAPRWIEVAPPDRNVILVLFTPEGDQDRIGTFSNVLFECDDIQVTHKELAARGVEFTEEPSKQFWGWWAVFKDPDGNTYGLGQRGE